MFKDIFPEESHRLVYRKPTKKAVPARKEAAGKKAKAKPKPKAKADRKSEGRAIIEKRRRAIRRKREGVTVEDKVQETTGRKPDYGRVLRDEFLAGAAELQRAETEQYLRQMGRTSFEGRYERFGESIGRIYDRVLLQDAHEKKVGLKLSDHASALRELREVPFHKIMEWYERSNKAGRPLAKGRPDYFPKEIRYTKVGAAEKGDTPVEKEARARRILWRTVDHFFKKAGGKAALRRRWVTMIDDPNFKAKSPADKNHQEFIQATGLKINDITWRLVLLAEIDPAEVAQSGKKSREKGSKEKGKKKK